MDHDDDDDGGWVGDGGDDNPEDVRPPGLTILHGESLAVLVQGDRELTGPNAMDMVFKTAGMGSWWSL